MMKRKNIQNFVPLFSLPKENGYCLENMGITFEGVTYTNLNQNKTTEPETLNLVIIYQHDSTDLIDKYKGTID